MFLCFGTVISVLKFVYKEGKWSHDQGGTPLKEKAKAAITHWMYIDETFEARYKAKVEAEKAKRTLPDLEDFLNNKNPKKLSIEFDPDKSMESIKILDTATQEEMKISVNNNYRTSGITISV